MTTRKLTPAEITSMAIDELREYNRHKTSPRNQPAIGGHNRWSICPACGRSFTATHRLHAELCQPLRIATEQIWHDTQPDEQ